MADTNKEYLQTNKFKVKLENEEWDKFIEVDGLGINFEVITNNEGGRNTMELSPGRAHMTRLVLKRRFRDDKSLVKWIKDIQAGKNIRKSGSVILLDAEGTKEVARFNFFKAFPCEWRAPRLSTTEKSDAAIETITLAVEDVELA